MAYDKIIARVILWSMLAMVIALWLVGWYFVPLQTGFVTFVIFIAFALPWAVDNY